MLCGGATVYSPLKMTGCGPGKRVGVVGIGGLGHFALLFAKALGADEVVAISRTRSKEADAKKLGADKYIATADQGWETKNANSLDIIVSTVSSSKDLPLLGYLKLLDVHGRFIQVGGPEEPFPAFSPFALITKHISLEGSSIGSPAQISEMLELAAAKKIKPWIEELPMGEANKAIVDLSDGKPRYRYVLKN
jgi:alcohol dehydrogenase (NADP+)